MRRYSFPLLVLAVLAATSPLGAQTQRPLTGTPPGVESQPSRNPKDFPKPALIEGQTFETRPPLTPADTPTFPGQTRAPYHASKPVKVIEITRALNAPWSFAFLPDGKFLVNERPGTMRILDEGGRLSAPLAGVPAVSAERTSGLHEVLLDPAFESNKRIYVSYAELQGPDAATMAIAHAVLDQEKNALRDVRVIFRAQPAVPRPALSTNQGGRLAWGRDGYLYATIGDRSLSPPWDIAQSLDNHLGKVIRITAEGAPAPGNPFIGVKGALPEIFTYGHRNSLGLAVHPVTGDIWETENGPWGGDELNILQAGKNYGWPVVVYGTDYQGNVLGRNVAGRETMAQPRYYWNPIIAPSGLAFYDGALFPQWKGSILVGAMRGRLLDRLTLEGDKVVSEEPLLIDVGSRLRDVRVRADGAVFVAMEEGKFLKLMPE